MKISRSISGVFPWCLCILASVSLLGCGGGSDSDPPVSPPANPPSDPVGLNARPANTTCIAPDSPNTTPTDVELYSPFPDLPEINFAVALKQLPNNNDWFYVVERGGIIKRFANDAAVTSTTEVLDISSQIDFLDSEGGLLGMAFHPDVATNLAVYLSYTTGASVGNGPDRSVISRFNLSADFTTIDPASEEVALELNQPAGNHNGGDIAFGPDGYLYIGFGDGGGFAQRVESQDTTNFFGAMLRIDVDPDTASAPFYSIPPSNPFFGDGSQAQEIFAYGFRNPWRWSFDAQTGDLWVADVGQNTYEEVNLVTNGGNYGWPIMEGNECFENNCDTSGLALPVHVYGNANGACSITGGYVYRGNQVTGLTGSYLFSDYCAGEILSLAPNTFADTKLADTFSNVAAFGQGNSGEVFVFPSNGDVLALRDVVGGGGGVSNIPTLLSDTGCFDATNPTQAAAGLIPYQVIAPLWSDGATKDRYLAIPDNTLIDVANDGDFSFPAGTILAKHFSYNGTMIETRLLMHHQTGWAGYSYEWNDAQTDATLLTAAKDTSVAGLNWHFPSPTECLQCHTEQKDVALGAEWSQLNHDFLYESTGIEANQVDTLMAIDVLSSAQSDALENLSLAALDDAEATIEERVKSYLHSNCSQCHLPGGVGGTMDLRYETDFAAMNICNATPLDDLGMPAARLLVPGNAAQSLIAIRMQRLDGTRMPPIASNVVDVDAVTLIEEWINGIATCP